MPFNRAIADRVLEGLADCKSLRAVCTAEGMPSHSTILAWLDDPANIEFADQYARVRARSYTLMADEIIEISDRSQSDVYTDEDGNERINTEVVARSRLMVDSRKWMLSKMLPKVYGDKIDATVTHSGAVAIEISIVDPAAR